MKHVSIGDMIRQLSKTPLPAVERDFVRIAAEKSGGGADTSVLDDKLVEIIDTTFRERFE